MFVGRRAVLKCRRNKVVITARGNLHKVVSFLYFKTNTWKVFIKSNFDMFFISLGKISLGTKVKFTVYAVVFFCHVSVETQPKFGYFVKKSKILLRLNTFELC